EQDEGETAGFERGQGLLAGADPGHVAAVGLQAIDDGLRHRLLVLDEEYLRPHRLRMVRRPGRRGNPRPVPARDSTPNPPALHLASTRRPPARPTFSAGGGRAMRIDAPVRWMAMALLLAAGGAAPAAAQAREPSAPPPESAAPSEGARAADSSKTLSPYFLVTGGA